MNSTCVMLAMLGVAEILVILVVMLGAAVLLTGAVLFALWLSKRPPARPSPAAQAAPLRACPRCGATLPTDAPQGLCPRCVLQVGIGTEDAAEPAFRDASGKPSPPDPAELARHFPQLEILELLGQGGMGAVYKARQKDLDRLVALKILPAGNGHDPAFAERFMREARALAKLDHPNIVAVHDFGQIQRSAGGPPAGGPREGKPGGAGAPSSRGADAPDDKRRSAAPAGGTPALLYYFIMEFIDGPNLRQLMQTRRLEPREALSIVPQICEALQFAHDEGIVHRDIKPENILLDRKGRVKIADFGIAKIVVKGQDATLTGAKDVIGTPHYMAPEQVERPTTVDHRADIYSLGVVFYEMLTGELPLGKFEVPSRKVQVDVRFDEVVLHSLEKEPERRYQHASEVKSDVETISSSQGGRQAEQPSATAAADRPPLKRWFAPLIVVRGGRRVLHWPGVAQDTFLLAGIYAICWLLAVLVLSPFVGTPHVGALFGGMVGFLAAMLAMGFYRSSRTATHRLRNVDSPSDGPLPRGGRWQPIAAALLLVGCVLLWGFAGFVTYVLPMVVERLAAQDAELPAIMRFAFQVGTVAHGFEVVLVPLLVLVTAGSLVWLFLSSTQPPRQSPGSSQSAESDGSRILRGMGLIAARWTARVLGTLLLLFYGTFIIAEGLPPIATQPQGVQLNFIALGLMLGGFAVGWKREGTAALLIASGWTLWHVSEGRFDWNLFQTPLPVAALYAYCWWELRGRRTRTLVLSVAALAALLGLGRLLVPTSVFVRGAVVDAQSGRPVPQAELRLLPRPARASGEDDAPNARSNGEGRFTLYVGWYVATKEVALSAPGYHPLSTNLGPRALGARNVSRDFLLQPTGPSVGAGTTLPGPVPPVVISTVPASGSRDVDPALTELRVTFSKPMRPAGFGWTFTGQAYPETRPGTHYWADESTSVLPVTLEPGRVYALWVDKQFSDHDGTPAVPYLLIFETRK